MRSIVHSQPLSIRNSDVEANQGVAAEPPSADFSVRGTAQFVMASFAAVAVFFQPRMQMSGTSSKIRRISRFVCFSARSLIC